MKTFIAVAIFYVVAVSVASALSGSGTTTRYWDCCKSSCSWQENVGSSTPVCSCSSDGVTHVDSSTQSGCDNGAAYVCNDQQPWAVNDSLAYGFVAASFTGGTDNSQCCVCLKLTFPDLPGKTLIVQNVNTGSDLGENHFDIQIPGGGVGIFTQGCQNQWNAPSTGWGDQYGGVSSDADCSQLPEELQDGCHFRFGWFQDANNPSVNFEQVTCPQEIVDRTGCENNNFS